MYRKIDATTLEYLRGLADKAGFQGELQIIPERTCDICKDENKTAHPYGHPDYRHLCNECFDWTGYMETEQLKELLGDKWTVTTERDKNDQVRFKCEHPLGIFTSAWFAKLPTFEQLRYLAYQAQQLTRNLPKDYVE